MEDIVRNIYNELLFRDPDSEGSKVYTDMMNAGHSKEQIERIIKKSDEYKHIRSLNVCSKVISYTIVCKYINVGLPRTGTQSLDYMCSSQLNLKSAHIIPHDINTIENFINDKDSFILRALYDYDYISDVPMFYPCIIKKILKTYPKIKLMSSTRSKNTWLQSIKKINDETINRFIEAANVQTIEELYDNHQSILEKYNIQKINIEDNVDTINQQLSDIFHQKVLIPKCDNANKKGFKVSSPEIITKHRSDIERFMT